MTRDEAARHLAELHVHAFPSTRIFRVLSPEHEPEESDSEPIKLLQVNEFTFPLDEILPLGFEPTASSGHFPTIIMDITPEQFDQLRADQIQLPRGWRLGEELTPIEIPSIGPKL